MRRLMAPLLVVALALSYVAPFGCSSSSAITGGGGCESFCNKWVGARCRNGPTRESCLEECAARESRCALENHALVKCATIEATIACETSSGQPRIVGCGPRETALDNCVACDRFCEGWAKLGCPRSPDREECLVACLDKRCLREHRLAADCNSGGEGACATDGSPTPSRCYAEYSNASYCTNRYGQPQPFRYIPIVLVDDAGRDARDGEVSDGG